ncbi:winged helix-turn-helix transcriptional regulator [Aurantivibrio infirmus]
MTREKPQFCIAEAKPVCPILDAMNIIGGKWKILIIYHLGYGKKRFGELRKMLPSVTQKMLTQQLRELEGDGVIDRTIYPEVPPRVEYKLTAFGDKLEPVLNELSFWGKEVQARSVVEKKIGQG